MCVGKIVTVEYVDDLDGAPIDGKSVDTVEFSYRGRDYTLILTREHGRQFDKDIARYISAAKKAQTPGASAARKKARPEPAKTVKKTPTSRRKSGRRETPTPSPARTRAIREWAAANGYDVSSRGRIASAITEAYDAKH